MSFKKKTWANRAAEYINRRRLIYADESTELVEVARDEGTILQEGDAFDAETMNDMEERIEGGFNDLIKENLGDLTFVKLTQSEYEALTTKDANTIYFTTD